MTLEGLLQLTTVAANFATATSIVIALVVYLYESRRHIQSRALDRFLALNEQYRDYLKMFVEHPDLHQKVPYAPRASKKNLDERQRGALFEIKICELESAYFLYLKQRTAFEKEQWQGWRAYMIDWLSNRRFREAWEAGIGDEYDRDFKEYMDDLLADLRSQGKISLQDESVEENTSEREHAEN